MEALKPSELSILLSAALLNHNPVLVTGAPGIGKTDVIKAVAAEAQQDLIISHPAVEDPTDNKGLPAAMRNKAGDTIGAAFFPFGQLEAVLNSKKPTIWFIDDLGQGNPSVQAGYMQWLLARECAGKKLPPHVTLFAATNRRQDKAGVSGMLEPVKSRFCTIVEMKSDYEDFKGWGLRSGEIGPNLLAFLGLRKDLLSDFKATADLTNSPSPRTWHNLAKVERMTLPRHIEAIAMCGAAGEGPAMEYLGFRANLASMMSLADILKDPTGVRLPNSPSEKYAVCIGLASMASEKTIKNIGIYANRLAAENMGEFAALTIRDSMKRNKAIANTVAFSELMNGPIGVLLSGQSI